LDGRAYLRDYEVKTYMERDVYSIEEIKEILVPLLKQHDIKKAVLFGSYAKQSATDSSDVDLFIDSGGFLNGLNFFSAYSHIEDKLNKKLDMIEAMDIDITSSLYKEIMEHGLVLYERP
jgi:predicted nucleotidyltransferase